MPRTSYKKISYASEASWLELRRNLGIGGSEAAVVMGLSPYKCSAELFFEKVLPTPPKKENLAMFMGKQQEDLTARLWEHYNNDGEHDFVARLYSGRPIRKARKTRHIFQSKRYPWMFATPDRVFTHVDANGKRHITCPLELKTISGWVVRKWDHGVPPMYIIQLMQYMHILNSAYGEMALLEDGRSLTVHAFEYAKDIADEIAEKTKVFWDNVLKTREELSGLISEVSLAHSTGSVDTAAELSRDLEAAVLDAAPPPDGSPAYEEFLKRRFSESTDAQVMPSEEMRGIVRAMCEIDEKIKELEDAKREKTSIIKNYMKDAAVLDLGIAGKITWRQNKNGQRVFRADRVNPNHLDDMIVL